MKVTKNQLKQLISEEIKNALSEVHSKPLYVPPQASQEKTPAPADSTGNADMSVEERLDSIDEKLGDILDKLETNRET